MELFTYFLNQVKEDRLNVIKWVDLLMSLKNIEAKDKVDAEYMLNELLSTYPINERTTLIILKNNL